MCIGYTVCIVYVPLCVWSLNNTCIIMLKDCYDIAQFQEFLKLTISDITCTRKVFTKCLTKSLVNTFQHQGYTGRLKSRSF